MLHRCSTLGLLGGVCWLLFGLLSSLAAQETEKSEPAAFGDPPNAKRLVPEYDVWIDRQRNLVILDGEVCLREGQLEMFACPRGTKEHESIVACNTKAFVVHAALLSVGAEVGHPVQFTPKYVPAAGSEVEIYLLWFDSAGKRRTARAQEWIRNAETDEEMTYNWVFAGSGFWTDEASGKRHYQAEAGDFICVSNFSSAMLDLPVESTQANQGLLFAAYTERIPPIGTKVRLVLAPKVDQRDPQPRE